MDAAIAHDLFKRAAELGDPDAQADMAVRYSLGLQPTSSNEDMLYELTTPNTPEALLNYFFAAAGNDTFAQMAMGYRHMYGVDVPHSCQAGLLYYNPVAERVVEAARYPGSLPQVLGAFSASPQEQCLLASAQSPNRQGSSMHGTSCPAHHATHTHNLNFVVVRVECITSK